jgi:hypothetical protein
MADDPVAPKERIVIIIIIIRPIARRVTGESSRRIGAHPGIGYHGRAERDAARMRQAEQSGKPA